MSDTSSPIYIQWVAPVQEYPVTPPTYGLTDTGISTVFLWKMEVRIPPGHAGLTGIALVDSGSFVIPYDPGNEVWIIGDDDLLEYPYEKELGSNVQLATFNGGSYNHGWQVRLFYTPMSALVTDEEAAISVGGASSTVLSQLD